MKFEKIPGLPGLEKFVGKKDYYILDKDRNVIPADVLEWGEFFNIVDHRIVKQENIDGFFISTVFLGIDHNWSWHKSNNEGYKPHIFETMIFNKGNVSEDYCDRCSTWQEAEEMHRKAVEWVKNKEYLKDEEEE